MIKYIEFKSYSLKYDEVFPHYLYLKEELPVYNNTEAASLRPQKKQPVTVI